MPSQRPLTTEERSRLTTRLDDRSSVGPFITITALVAGIFIWGGLLSWILRLLTVPDNTAAMIGMTIGMLGALEWLRRARGRHRAVGEEREAALRADLEAGVAQVQRLEVSRAWEVVGLEDFGPGYVLGTEDGGGLYVATQAWTDLAASDDDLPPREVEVSWLARSATLLDLRGQGEPATMVGAVAALPIDRQVVVLTASDLQERIAALTA